MIKNSILIGLSFLLSKILGLAREVLLASYFGVQAASSTHNLDAYFAAFKLPDFVFTMVSSGVISAAFVPLFVEYLTKHNKERARQFASDSLYALSVFILVVSVIFFIGAPYFVRLLVPGFAPDVFAVTVDLTRIMLISPLLFTISGVFGGINNSLNHFRGIALAPIFYNLGIIGGTMLWGKEFGVYGVAYGVIIGAILSTLVMLPEAHSSGVKLMAPRALWNEHVKRLLSLALPRIAGMSITQVSLIVDTFLASLLAAGSLTYMNLASNVYFVPIGVVGITIAVTRFGQLASLALTDDRTDFTRAIQSSLQTLMFILIPTTVGMIMLSTPLIEVLFMRGSFTQANVLITSQTVQIFSLGIIGTSLVQVLTRGFYALKDTKTPLYLGGQTFLINATVGAIAAFYFKLGTYGLALGTTISSTSYAIMLLYRLTKKLNYRTLFSRREILIYLASSVVMLLVCLLTLNALKETSALVRVIVTSTVGALTYAAGVYFSKSVEAREWVNIIQKRVGAKLK